jgi:hypothetical protein
MPKIFKIVSEEPLSLNEVLACLCYVSHWLTSKGAPELSHELDKIYSKLLDQADSIGTNDNQDLRKNIASSGSKIPT